MTAKKIFGAAGERVAELYYQQLGYRVLARNYRLRGGELDLVLYKHPMVVFVEVKHRSILRYWECEMPVSPQQFQRVQRMARVFLFRERARIPDWSEARIDLVLVTQGRVKHRISEYVG
jgi:putative endonuclease